ncbi:MAG: SGNH/GDSL hydrolase family protein [Gemmataceae bacterium]|nr:SGNH/GDSL hydrolase family protein [Gemmataceae bacterium]
MIRLFAVAAVFLAASSTATAQEFFLKPGKVLFLGDSNTYAGAFVAYVDAYLASRFPDRKYELINMGLPSETVTGLSEKDHPWPRPDVHERVQRALDKIKPNYVVVCYGMNDGIYHPFSADRFEKYKQTMQSLLEKIRKAGAQPIVMTPCPFDPMPLKGKTRPKDADDFSYRAPYEGYDEVLTKYSEWLVSLRSKDLHVADAHSAIVEFLAEVRAKEPKYFISGDGIHPNPTGHAIVAFTLLKTLNAPGELGSAEIPAGKESVKAEVKIPMPSLVRHAYYCRQSDVDRAWNRWTLKAKIPAGQNREVVFGGTPVAPYSSEDLAKGVTIRASQLIVLLAKAHSVLELATERERLVRHAWLTEVGHKRPDIPKGQPLEKVEPKLREIDREMRALVQPLAIEVELRKLEK